MAGNIPLVGFHDFLSVLISGHSVIVKQSSSDKHLLPFLAKYLEYVEEGLKEKLHLPKKNYPILMQLLLREAQILLAILNITLKISQILLEKVEILLL